MSVRKKNINYKWPQHFGYFEVLRTQKLMWFRGLVNVRHQGSSTGSYQAAHSFPYTPATLATCCHAQEIAPPHPTPTKFVFWNDPCQWIFSSQRRIKNPLKHLRSSFLQKKKLTAESRKLFYKQLLHRCLTGFCIHLCNRCDQMMGENRHNLLKLGTFT